MFSHTFKNQFKNTKHIVAEFRPATL